LLFAVTSMTQRYVSSNSYGIYQDLIHRTIAAIDLMQNQQ
jgi:hypothetical protein